FSRDAASGITYLYLRDRCTDPNGVAIAGCTPSTTQLDAPGTVGTQYGGSLQPSISDDGRYVAFMSAFSYGSSLPGAAQACVRDRCKSNGIQVPGCSTAMTIVERNYIGQPGDALNDASRPSISADGRFVVYESDADNQDGNSAVTNIYLRDMFANPPTISKS